MPIRFFYRTPRLLHMIQLGLEPSFSDKIDDFSSRPGSYHLYFDLSKASPLVEVMLDIFLRPSPDTPPLLYQHITINPRAGEPSLWDITLPISAGFEAVIKQLSFRTILIPVYIWEV